jgi:TonB-dependent SusC/RagA subfamily outer membrane receptor
MNEDVRWRGLQGDSLGKVFPGQGYHFVFPERPKGDWMPRQGGNIYYWGDSVRTWNRQFGPADDRQADREKLLKEVREKMQELRDAKGKAREQKMEELERKMEELQKLGRLNPATSLPNLQGMQYSSVRQPNQSRTIEGSARLANGVGISIRPGTGLRLTGIELNPLYLINGQIVERIILEALDPSTIETMLVLEKQSAQQLYGDRGKEGAVLVSTRQAKRNQSRTITVDVGGQGDHYDNNVTVNVGDQATIVNRSNLYINKSDSTNSVGQHLYVLDEEIVALKSVGDIDPREIKVITVLRGKNATTKYGSQGANGVIEITTKSAQPRAKAKPLYVLDGQEVAETVVKQLPPNQIQSMRVSKGPEVIAKYGEKGREGVVEITTKGAASQPSNTRTEEVAVETLRVFPNPVGEQMMLNIVVELDKASQVSLQATDLQGRSVADILPTRTLERGRNTIGWSTKGLSAGTYFINLALNGRVLTKRVVIE